MTYVYLAWKYRNDIAIIGGLIALLILGLVIWGQHQTIAGQAATLKAKDGLIELRTDERDTARKTAEDNAKAVERLQAEKKKADEAQAADAQHTADRSKFIADAHKEVSRVQPKQGAALAAGPYTSAALDRLRARKAGRAADAH